MGLELTGVDEYIYVKLSGDATLVNLLGAPTNIFEGVAPPNTTPPWVVFEHQGGDDVMGLGARRIFTKPLYLVRVIGRTSKFSDIRPLADRVDIVLHKSAGSGGAVTVPACIRLIPYQLSERDGDVEWRHLGAYFRFYAQ